MYYPCSENKGADQLRSYCKADLRFYFRISRLLIFLCSGSFKIILVILLYIASKTFLRLNISDFDEKVIR